MKSLFVVVSGRNLACVTMKCFMSWDTLACLLCPPILTRLFGSKNGSKWKSHLALFNSSLVVLVSNLLISSFKASSCMCLTISCSAAFSSFSHRYWVILACSRSCQSINQFLKGLLHCKLSGAKGIGNKLPTYMWQHISIWIC